MAYIKKETITVNVLRLVKDQQAVDSIVDHDIASTVEEVVQQLIGDRAVVEVEITAENS